MRTRTIVIVLGLVLSLVGCPREIQPPPPGEARPCETHPDCNGGRTCGELSLCVGGFCEEAASVAVACPAGSSDVVE